MDEIVSQMSFLSKWDYTFTFTSWQSNYLGCSDLKIQIISTHLIKGTSRKFKVSMYFHHKLGSKEGYITLWLSPVVNILIALLDPSA